MNAVEYLEHEALRPFEWGVTDCATTADRWFQIVRGFSAMQHYGRTVTSEAHAQAWLDMPGGLVRATRSIMRAAGVKTLRGQPVSGDIGVIIVDGRACVSIYDGALWRSRDADGFIAADDTHRFTAWGL